MKVVRVIVLDDEGNEQSLNVADGLMLVVTDDNKVLTQTTQNANINLEVLRKVLIPSQQ